MAHHQRVRLGTGRCHPKSPGENLCFDVWPERASNSQRTRRRTADTSEAMDKQRTFATCFHRPAPAECNHVADVVARRHDHASLVFRNVGDCYLQVIGGINADRGGRKWSDPAKQAQYVARLDPFGNTLNHPQRTNMYDRHANSHQVERQAKRCKNSALARSAGIGTNAASLLETGGGSLGFPKKRAASSVLKPANTVASK